jgi:hypothetical protein
MPRIGRETQERRDPVADKQVSVIFVTKPSNMQHQALTN